MGITVAKLSLSARAQCAGWAAVAAVCLVLFVSTPASFGQGTGNRIPSTAAFSEGCSDVDLGGITIPGFGSKPSPQRVNPEWAAIITDSSKSILEQTPQVVEGTVSSTPDTQQGNDYQMTAEVAEEDIAWNHYTHDYTFKLTPDPPYQVVLSYYVNPDSSLGYQPDMEVEWDNASYMDQPEGFQRIWGAVPEFVWPAVGDRIWVLGRWIFDCGHPGIPKGGDATNVRFETEIHPPKALVTYRLFHPALDSFPRDRTSAPNFPGMQSYLPVTGVPQSGTTAFPTSVPLTEADIFVSGNGGGANDLCSLVPVVGSLLTLDQETSCGSGHTTPVLPVNDRNYVFDIYPPVTDYQLADTSGAYTMINGNKVYPFTVFPPVPDASLQYRIVDHSTELPTHTCGTSDPTNCVAVTPIICLIDNTTPPPNQSETSCPAVPARPTRLRVILPFKGTNANYFAQSILVGWDDVPTPDNNTVGVRTFQIRLHKLTVNQNGSHPNWRVFVNVGGQWRYISPYFDTNSNGGTGIWDLDKGANVCSGIALTNNSSGNCFQFDNTPWTVSIGQQANIHVAVGGFVARGLEGTGAGVGLCRNYPGGCDPNFSLPAIVNLISQNDGRIGAYEFDLTNYGNYQRPNTFETAGANCPEPVTIGTCTEQYTTDFSVEELDAGTPPASSSPQVGDPHYNNFITSATPITLSSSDASAQGFQYRFHLQGGALPTYSSTLPFPVHWANANFSSGESLAVYLNGASAMGDGPYDFQYSANSAADLLEPRHTQTLILDNTPPVATITQPAATQYTHADMLVLAYTVSDGTGSGVKSSSAQMDGSATLPDGTAVTGNGQSIPLLLLPLGTHTFTVNSLDNVNNAGTNSVTFSIVVTPASLIADVNILESLGCITNSGIGQSLIVKINATQSHISHGQLQAAINTLAAFIHEVQVQSKVHIPTICSAGGHQYMPVQILIGDAQYLQTSLGSQLQPDPIMGSVVDSSNVGVSGATVSLVGSSKAAIATATTDSTGFYFFENTNGLSVGGTYSVTVTLPKGYQSATPPFQSFTWQTAAVTLGNFVLN